MYRYTVSDKKWTPVEEKIEPQNNAKEEYGVYRVDSTVNSDTFDVLSACKT